MLLLRKLDGWKMNCLKNIYKLKGDAFGLIHFWVKEYLRQKKRKKNKDNNLDGFGYIGTKGLLERD